MTDQQFSMFGEALGEIASGPCVSSYQDLTERLMRRMAEKGWTLAQLSEKKAMNRSLSTLKKNARKFEITFPDYTPRAKTPKNSGRDDE